MRRNLATVRGCWVCGHRHYARDDHSKQEVLKAINKIRAKSSNAFNVTQINDFEWALINDDDDASDSESSVEDSDTDNSSDSGQLTDMIESKEKLAQYLSNVSYLHATQPHSSDLLFHREELETLLAPRDASNFDESPNDAGLTSHSTERNFKGIIMDTRL